MSTHRIHTLETHWSVVSPGAKSNALVTYAVEVSTTDKIGDSPSAFGFVALDVGRSLAVCVGHA